MKSARLHLQRYLITGILTLLPLWLTWVVFRFIFNLLSGVSTPWIRAIAEPLARNFPTAMGWVGQSWVQSVFALIATIVVIYAVGFAANRVLGRRLLQGFEALVNRIPFVQGIYGGAKKLLDVVQTKPDGAQRVVLIEFPHPGLKAIGLVTRTFRDQGEGQEYAAVFVPTTPNPTGGYLEIVPLDKLTPTDWSVDQAMAFLLSGGALAPERLSVRTRGESDVR
jgi:uncharacterized membrane protein